MTKTTPKTQRLHAKPLENVQLARFYPRMGGFNWLYENKYTKETLSIICHQGSYGGSDGLFEIMPSWTQPTPHDSIEGWLSFPEVGKWMQRLNRRKSAAGAATNQTPLTGSATGDADGK